MAGHCPGHPRLVPMRVGEVVMPESLDGNRSLAFSVALKMCGLSESLVEAHGPILSTPRI